MQRREGDVILIGDEIVIQILENTRSRVKIGLIAPRHLAIVRGEVYKVGNQNRAAVSGTANKSPGEMAERLRAKIPGRVAE